MKWKWNKFKSKTLAKSQKRKIKLLEQKKAKALKQLKGKESKKQKVKYNLFDEVRKKASWFYRRNLKNLIKKTPIRPNDTDIIFDDVSYIYSPKTPYEFKAMSHIDLTIKKFEIIAVIGSTGSGKSSLVQHMNGLLIPTSGILKTYGWTIYPWQKKIAKIKNLRRQIGLVFQFPEYQLFEETVLKDIMFGPLQMGATKKNADFMARKCMTDVGLPAAYLERSPFDLSGGQKRRVAVAGILAMEGTTLVLDEPTAGLDPHGEEMFLKLFRKLHEKENKRIIVVTHNMDHVIRLADRVIVMDEGAIIKEGTPFEIFSDKDIIQKLNIEPPKLYSLIYKLKNNGIDLTEHRIYTVEDLAHYLAAYIKKQKPIKKQTSTKQEA